MTRRFCLLLLGGAAAAQLIQPRIGYIVDRDGGLRAVEGVAGAFTLTPVLEHEVVSVAFSGKSLVVKKASEIKIDDRSFDAPEGPAVVVFDAKGKAAEVFFPSARLLWRWQDGEFLATPAYDVISDSYIREGELLVAGIPVQLPALARQVSQLGEGWLAVYSDECVYAVRGRQVFELPEGGVE